MISLIIYSPLELELIFRTRSHGVISNLATLGGNTARISSPRPELKLSKDNSYKAKSVNVSAFLLQLCLKSVTLLIIYLMHFFQAGIFYKNSPVSNSNRFLIAWLLFWD